MIITYQLIPEKRSKKTPTYQGQIELKIAFSTGRTLKNNDCRDLKYLPTKNEETRINREWFTKEKGIMRKWGEILKRRREQAMVGGFTKCELVSIKFWSYFLIFSFLF